MGSSQQKSTKKSKSKANEDSSSKGKELREWMKKNKIWEKTLFDHLLSNDITSDTGLATLNQAQFDDLVRRVRVQRFEELKSQKARNRLDKLLVSFEKQWRKASGI